MGKNAKIPGGAVLWARKTIESDVFYNKPDKWFKIWFYLVCKANHKDTKRFPRGSCFMKYEWIMEKVKATRSEVDHCMRWLKSATMIATRKAIRGFTVDVLSYDDHQNLENYKSDTKSDTKSEVKAKQKRNKSDTKDKNVKNDKNDKKILSPLDKIMVKYQKKFPEQRKLFGLGGIIRARDYFEGCHDIGWHYNDILGAIEKAEVSEPWKIITLSDKKSKTYAKEWEELVKKKEEEHEKN